MSDDWPSALENVAIRVDELVTTPGGMDHFKAMVLRWYVEHRARDPEDDETRENPARLLSRRTMSLAEEYAAVAAVRDAICDGDVRINPWADSSDPKEPGGVAWAVMCGRVKELRKRAIPRIEAALRHVEGDLSAKLQRREQDGEIRSPADTETTPTPTETPPSDQPPASATLASAPNAAQIARLRKQLRSLQQQKLQQEINQAVGETLQNLAEYRRQHELPVEKMDAIWHAIENLRDAPLKVVAEAPPAPKPPYQRTMPREDMFKAQMEYEARWRAEQEAKWRLASETMVWWIEWCATNVPLDGPFARAWEGVLKVGRWLCVPEDKPRLEKVAQHARARPVSARAVATWTPPPGTVGTKAICLDSRFQKNGKNPPRTTIDVWLNTARKKGTPPEVVKAPDSGEVYLPESWVLDCIKHWNPRQRKSPT